MIPKTRRHGQAQAIAMLHVLKQANWNRDAPTKSTKFVDARIRACLEWPAEARRGFTGVIAEWLRTDVQGFGYNLEGYSAALRRSWRTGSRKPVTSDC
jgi:hypothetical protein